MDVLLCGICYSEDPEPSDKVATSLLPPDYQRSSADTVGLVGKGTITHSGDKWLLTTPCHGIHYYQVFRLSLYMASGELHLVVTPAFAVNQTTMNPNVPSSSCNNQ